MGLGGVILLKFFDWTTPEATKPLWKSPKKPVDPPKKMRENANFVIWRDTAKPYYTNWWRF